MKAQWMFVSPTELEALVASKPHGDALLIGDWNVAFDGTEVLEVQLWPQETIRRCEECESPFQGTSRAKFCKATCRVIAWRRRHPNQPRNSSESPRKAQ